MLKTECAWCGEPSEFNLDKPHWCKRCLHRVGVAKENCDCLNCSPFPTVLPEVPPPFRFLQVEQPLAESTPTDYQGGGIEVVGRFFKHPVFNVTVFPSRIVLRIDDGEDSEQWVHVVLSEEVIYRWAREMTTADESDDNGDGIE